MKKTMLFNFLVDRENRTIKIQREFEAVLHKVWDAFTIPELLDQWWAPKPWKSKTKSMEFKEGGTRLYAMIGPQGEEHWAYSTYLKIVRPDYFSGDEGFADEQGKINTSMPIRHSKTTFISKGPITLVEVVSKHETLEQLDILIKMGFKEGFTMALNNLEELISI